MVNDSRWVALFSQTGSEIVEISKRLKKWPDVIITNSDDYESIHSEIKKRGFIKVNSVQARTLNVLHRYAQKNDLITLNGWLRIVPADKCEQYNLVNGHPGLITRYPELKGFDPQINFWNKRDKYRYYGSVVHEVTAEVDEGKILNVCEREYKEGVQDNPFDALRETSLQAWMEFFKQQDLINVQL